MLTPSPGPIPYELRLGVTGHRELPDAAAVTRAVRALLRHVVDVLERASADPLGPHGSPRSRLDRVDRRLAEAMAVVTGAAGTGVTALFGLVPGRRRRPVNVAAYPRVRISPRRPRRDERTPLELTVISALAAGTDQIVARAVCDLLTQSAERRPYVEVVLPFPVAEYERDFATPGDLEAFRQLLALDRDRPDAHPEPTVIFPGFPGCPDPSDPARTLSREQAYAAAGRAVVDASELVVAVWDPSREQQPGGTGATVRYALERGRSVLWLDPAHLDAGPSLLRPGSGNQPGHRTVARPFGYALPVPVRARQISENFHRLAAYNRDRTADPLVLAHERIAQGGRLHAAATASGLPSDVTDLLVNTVLPYVIRADALGRSYKQLRDLAARLWPIAAAFAVTLMSWQILFAPAHHWVAFVELLVLALGYLSYRVSVVERWHEKWLNDRRLAEGLRSALFASLVRVSSSPVMRTASGVGGSESRIRHTLAFYNPANTWFVESLKRVLAREYRRVTLDLSDPRVRRATAAFLGAAWIGPQADYHASQAAIRTTLVQRGARLRLGVIIALSIVAILHATGVGHTEAEAAISAARLDLWLALATVAVPAWAAALHVMLSIDDHQRLAERSARMSELLRGLASRLDRVNDAAELRACVDGAEQILDLESAEWAESMIDRKPEFTG